MQSTHFQTARPTASRSRRFAPVLFAGLSAPALLGLWSWNSEPQSGPESPATAIGARSDYPAETTPADARRDASNPEQVQLASHEIPKAGRDPAAPADANRDVEEKQRRQVVGDWEDDYQGHRHLTVRDDGTATMVIETTGIARKIFAERLQFEIEWTYADGRIVMVTTGGEPAKKVQVVTKLYGTRAEYKLVNLDDNQLLLLDADGKTRYDWRRVRSKPASQGSSDP